MQETYTLNLSAPMVRIIMGALAEGQYRTVAQTIAEIDRQVREAESSASSQTAGGSKRSDRPSR